MRVIEIITTPVTVYTPEERKIQLIKIYVDKESFSQEQEEKINQFFRDL
jgi:hypothetical protein